MSNKKIVTGNTEAIFEILEHKGILKARDDGWNKEANLVSWNGGPAKLDIRDWSEGHDRMTRGITLFEEQGIKLKEILDKALPEEKDFPGEDAIPKRQSVEITFDILDHLGVLENRTNGWSREVNIVSWNGGIPKVDIRDWSSDHERMTRGITLYRDEADALRKCI